MKKLVTFTIYICFFIFGFFLMEKLEKAMIETNTASENIQYITTEENFEKFMNSQSLSKAFVTGTIEAINPIIIPEDSKEFPPGEYMFISANYYKIESQLKINKRDKGINKDKLIEIHSSIPEDYKTSSPFTFLGKEFYNNEINIPYPKMIKEDFPTETYKVEYYARPKKYENATIYIERNNGTITYSEYVKPENLESEIEIKTRFFQVDFFKILSAIIYYSFITFLFIGKLKIDKDIEKTKKTSNNPQDFNNFRF